MKLLSIIYILFIALYLTNCASTNKKASVTGSLGNECYENNTCNEGFSCKNDICIIDKCLGISCNNNWEECNIENGECVARKGYCSQDSDCNTENNELCTSEHRCSVDLCHNTDCSADLNSSCNSETGNCDCIENFHNEEGHNECLPSSKTVSCLNPNIENSEYLASSVIIHWGVNDKTWEKAPLCDWFCKEGFYKTETNSCEKCNCEDWELCGEQGLCSLGEGRCDTNGDCRLDNQICNNENYCIDADNPCEGQVCNNHGICSVVEGQAICICDEGFYNNGNLSCANPCEGKLCSNKGTCIATNMLDAHCECDLNYFADRFNCISPCEGHWDCNLGDITELPDRTGIRALGTNDPRGVCTASDSETASCECFSGYSDDDNDLICTSICSGVTCGGHGTCVVTTENLPSCNCDLGYSIDSRDTLVCININDCSPNPCLNHGICVDGIDDYDCLCTDAWTGDNCETEAPCGGGCEEWEFCADATIPNCQLKPGRCNTTRDCETGLCRTIEKSNSSTSPPPVDECYCDTINHICEMLEP